MKKICFLFLAAICFWGCSSSHPSVTNTAISDQNPVTGQKVLFQVVALSDNYPLTYSWQADSGTLDTWESTDNFAYWKAPANAGTSVISCTVTDDADNSETHVFNVNVAQRSIETLYNGTQVTSMKKQEDVLIAGVWVCLVNGEVHYTVSSSDQVSTTWQGAFNTMETSYNSTTAIHYLWGAYNPGNTIYVQSTEGTSTVTCEKCTSSDIIHDLLYDSGVLWVGAVSGMHWYSSTGENWGTLNDYLPAQYETNSIILSNNYIYFASANGVYKFDPLSTPVSGSNPVLLYSGDSTAVLEIVGDDKTTPDTVESDGTSTIWHLTGHKVCKNGTALAEQPPDVAIARTLDKDLDGYIWCGKYWWDGLHWQSPAGLDNVSIVSSLVSNEGRVYLVSESGTLFCY